MDDCNKEKAKNDELAHDRIKSADYDQLINELNIIIKENKDLKNKDYDNLKKGFKKLKDHYNKINNDNRKLNKNNKK